MPKVALLVLESCYASSLTGFMDLLQVANAHAQKQLGEQSAKFEWEFLSLNGGSVVVSGGLPIAATSITETDAEFDLIYIPGIFYSGADSFGHFIERHQMLVDWLRNRYKTGSLLAANCTGTFLLAETGLLDGCSATTTWWLERQFRQRYPKVALDVRQLLTEDHGLFCAGAITTYQQLALRVVERFFSPSIASLCAKALLVDLGRDFQMPYQRLSETEEHTDRLVAQVQYRMQQDLRKRISIQQLADEFSVSPRTLIRRFKAAISIQPRAYLQNLRLEAAKHLLETSNLNIEEVILEVGYEDPSSFSRLFHQRVGMTPASYREKFRPKRV